MIPIANNVALPLRTPFHQVVKCTADPVANGQRLRAAYAAAGNLAPGGLPLSATNRATVLLPPGTYRFKADLELSASFVDVMPLVPADGPNAVLSFAAGARPMLTGDATVCGLLVRHDSGAATRLTRNYPMMREA